MRACVHVSARARVCARACVPRPYLDNIPVLEFEKQFHFVQYLGGILVHHALKRFLQSHVCLCRVPTSEKPGVHHTRTTGPDPGAEADVRAAEHEVTSLQRLHEIAYMGT